MKKLFLPALALIITVAAMAQDKKVAVFDPAGSVDKFLKEIVREEISSIIVNSVGYTVLERQLIDKVLEENKFQSGGLVDDSQISEIGKRMGANMVFVTNITAMGTNFYISVKMIDVMTARIDKQKTAQTQKGSNDLLPVVQKMVGEMFGKESGSQAVTKPAAETKPAQPAQQFAGMLTNEGRAVFQGGRELSKKEVRQILAGTDALRYYNKGISRNRKGNAWLWTGIPVFAIGLSVFIVQPFGYWDDYGYWVDDTSETLGGVFMGIGSGMILGGTILKLTSTSPVKKAVDMYNSGSRTASNAELKAGFTGNGVGLVLNF